MSNFQPNVTRHRKSKNPYSEKTKELSDLNSDMAKILELHGKKFNVTMTNVLKALMEMLENMQINRVISVDELQTMRKRLVGVTVFFGSNTSISLFLTEPKNTVE